MAHAIASWPAFRRGIATLALVACLLAAEACGTTATTQHATTASSSNAAEVFFPQLRPSVKGGPDALMGGTLVLDENGCLRVDDPGWVPIWPASYELATEGEEIRIRDDKGRIVAQTGKEVRIGGGEVGLQKDLVNAATARELRNRCVGDDYLMVTEASLQRLRGE